MSDDASTPFAKDELEMIDVLATLGVAALKQVPGGAPVLGAAVAITYVCLEGGEPSTSLVFLPNQHLVALAASTMRQMAQAFLAKAAEDEQRHA
jgi:hypothetical protein